MIKVSNLSIDYPNFTALRDITFEVKPGSITALVGPNGAGKTTLLKCLAGLEQPMRGRILVDGIDVSLNPREINKLIGFLPDFYGLHLWLTVRQVFTYSALAYKVPENLISTKIEELAELLNLTDKLDVYVNGLSRGMKQRVAIGQALVHNPKLLLLDEPAGGLDPEARYNLGLLFKHLNSQGITILVSSHILAELNEYATDMIIMKKGRIVDQPASILSSDKTTINIVIACEDSQGCCAVLAGFDYITRVNMINESILITIPGDKGLQIELLKGLISRGVMISEFYIENSNLQEKYLEIIKDKGI